MEGLLTCAEFAAACGMKNASTLRRWVSAGTFAPADRIKNKLYFSRTQIAEARAKHKPEHGRYARRSKNETDVASLFDNEEVKSMNQNENTVGTANVGIAESSAEVVEDTAKCACEARSNDSEVVDGEEYPLLKKAAEGTDNQGVPFSTREEESGGDDTLTEGNDVEAVDTPDNTASENETVETEEPKKPLPPIARNRNGSVEWYTPADIVEAARKVLDAIDLDPASSIVANETVKAEKFFTADDDGLAKEWSGHVFMNPPFTSGLIEKFVDKLVAEYTARKVTEAVVVVDNATETRWFNQLVEASAAIVFTRGRVNFLNGGTLQAGSPTRGQAFLYFGNTPDKFVEVFSRFGWGCIPCKGAFVNDV